MKGKLLLVCVIAFALIWSPVTAQDQDEGCHVIYLFNGWARATVPGAPNGVAFGFLVNLTNGVDTLVGASTDVAEAVELHQMVMGDGDVMQMRPVEGIVSIEPNNYLEFRPGGFHIMLINLKKQLVDGEMLDLSLEFEHAGEVMLSVPIKDIDEMMPMAGMDSQMDVKSDMSDLESHRNMDMMEWGEACQGIHFLGGWVRPAMAGMPNSAAYGLLLNLTNMDDVLVGGTTEVAEAVELHDMAMGDDDVMQMRLVEGGLSLPAGEAVLLQPGGLHLMLIGLTQALEAESTIDIQLQFEESEAFDLIVPVKEPVEEMEMMGDMSG